MEQTENENNHKTKVNFSNKLKSLHIVQFVLLRLSKTYGELKEKSLIVHQFFNLIESLIQISLLFATPLFSICAPSLDCIDKFGCFLLEKLEHSFPIIKEDTETLILKANESISDLNIWMFNYSYLNSIISNLITNSLEAIENFIGIGLKENILKQIRFVTEAFKNTVMNIFKFIEIIKRKLIFQLNDQFNVRITNIYRSNEKSFFFFN
jgi:hypothetical protein